MAAMQGKYFSKPKLLSEKIQDLIDDVNALPGFDASPSFDNNNNNNNNVDSNLSEQKTSQEESSSQQQQQQEQQPQQPNKKEKKQKQKQEKQGKGKQKGGGGGVKGGAKGSVPDIGRCEFVVGKIVKVGVHPNADRMYLEMVDIGESEPRQIVSGLRDFVPIEEMQDSLIVVFKNLKPAALRDIVSYGMVFAAKNEDGSIVELIRPAKGSIVGERLVLENDDLNQYTPDEQVNSKKKNSAWMKIKDALKTNDKMEACYNGQRFLTSAGPLMCKTLTNAPIS